MSTRPQLTDEVEANRMPLMEHLRELRYRVIVSAVAMAVGMIGGLVFATDIYEFLRAPIRVVFDEKPPNRMDGFYLWLSGPIQRLLPESHSVGSLNNSSSPMESMYAFFQIGLVGGVLFAVPVIAFQVWRFVAPGLYDTEKRYVVPLAAASTFLFLLGAMFCYAVILPISLPFFMTTLPDTTNQISVQGYLSDIVRMLAGFGASFQLPVVVWFFARLGLVDHLDLVRGFRYAIVGVFAAAAIITPTTDLFSQFLLAVPLIGLYVVGIGVAFFATTKQRSTEGV